MNMSKMGMGTVVVGPTVRESHPGIRRNLCSKSMMLLTLFVVASAATTQAQNRVDRTIDWPSREFSSLQSAINALPDGGTIRIASGEYRVSEALFVTNKLITIEGAGCAEAPLGRTSGCDDGGTTRQTTGATEGDRTKRTTHLIGPRRERFVEARLSVGLLNFVNAGGVIRGLKR